MKQHLKEACELVKSRCAAIPDIALILGSGLSSLAEQVHNPILIPYNELPGFPVSTAPGHKSELIIGNLEGHRVIILMGRFHYYEGYDLSQIVYPVRFLNALGCLRLLITNASGGINRSFSPGTLMLIRDHINLTGQNPLRGENDATLGPRFPDMSFCWNGKMAEAIRTAAKNRNIELQEGVYSWFTGPSFETPAEIRMASVLGADAAGMSTVPEAIAATHCGIEIAGISCITNMAAGILNKTITSEEVFETGRKVKVKFATLIQEFLRILPTELEGGDTGS